MSTSTVRSKLSNCEECGSEEVNSTMTYKDISRTERRELDIEPVFQQRRQVHRD